MTGATMQILINTDHHIEGHAPLIAHVTNVFERALHRFSEYVTRAEIHLSDEKGQKNGASEQRCLAEVRLQGRPPLAVKHDAASLHQAIEGAAQKLVRAIDDDLGRQRDKALHSPSPELPEA